VAERDARPATQTAHLSLQDDALKQLERHAAAAFAALVKSKGGTVGAELEIAAVEALREAGDALPGANDFTPRGKATLRCHGVGCGSNVQHLRATV